jgi:hypothetical protein
MTLPIYQQLLQESPAIIDGYVAVAPGQTRCKTHLFGDSTFIWYILNLSDATNYIMDCFT